MITRRSFLSTTAAAACTAAFGAPSRAKMSRLSVQMYSIRQVFWNEPEKNLERLRAAGFDGIEFYQYGPSKDKWFTAKELKKMLADTGMVASGTHTAFGWKGDDLKKTLEFCSEAGFDSLTCSWAMRKTADEWTKFGEDMSLVAEDAKKYGLPFSLHNHEQEFKLVYDGVTAWDCIYKNASPLLLQQIDTCQVVHPGADLMAVLKKYRNRHHSMHAKENIPSPYGILGQPPTDGGKMVPWDEVLAYMATEPDFKWYVIECERVADTLMPCIESAKYLLPKIKAAYAAA